MSKINLKVGQVTVEFEGSEEFIKDGLFNLVKDLSELDSNQQRISPEVIHLSSDNGENLEVENTSSIIEGTINSIAAKLNVSSGPELIIAAACHLHFVKNQPKFNRTDLLEQCKEAPNYFKKSHSGNFSQNINSLVKNNKLIEVSKDVFSIPAQEIEELKNKLS